MHQQIITSHPRVLDAHSQVLSVCGNGFTGDTVGLMTMTKPPPMEVVAGHERKLFLALKPPTSPWPVLRELHLGQNGLSGDVGLLLRPELPSLVHLSASSNQLTGRLEGLTQLPSLQFLFLDHNKWDHNTGVAAEVGGGLLSMRWLKGVNIGVASYLAL